MVFEVGAPAHAGQIVVDALVRENVKRLYCLPGSHLLQFYDALREAPSIGLVTCKQEPNASLMADAYGRLTGEPGVCLLTAGPGGANSIAGVAQAYGAASPMVHITGSVPLDASREAFHGVDDPDFLVDMFGKVTKWSVRVQRMEDISGVMARAFHVARSGRPGPVHVEIPRLSDYSPHLLQETPIALPEYAPQPVEVVAPNAEDVAQYARRLLAAKYPVICAGKGVMRKGAMEELARVADKFSIPVIYPQDSMGVIPEDHPLAVGHYFAFRNTSFMDGVTSRCDLMMFIGLRAATAEVEHIDPYAPADRIFIGFDDEEDAHYGGADEIVADPGMFLSALEAHLEDESGCAGDEVREQIAQGKADMRRQALSVIEGHESETPIHPALLMEKLSRHIKPDAIVVSDVGNCQMFARYYVPLTNQFSFMQSGVWNAMSFALPTAIVAKMEYPERDVIGLVGDGAFLMTIGDFVTASEYGANIVMIVLNDGSYGQIDRQLQNLYGAAYGCDFKSPHFADMARSFDAWGVRVEDPADLDAAIEAALSAGKPAIVEVMTREQPLPKIS